MGFRLRLPPTFPLFEANGSYDAPRLLDWFGGEVDSLAAQFDARNGNDYHARWFADRKNPGRVVVNQRGMTRSCLPARLRAA